MGHRCSTSARRVMACAIAAVLSPFGWIQPAAVIAAEKLIDRDNTLAPAFAAGAARADVIVNLTPPLQLMAATNYGARQSLSVLQREIARRQDDVLKSLPVGDFEVKFKYENICAIAGAITQKGLTQLLADVRVESIEADVIDEAHLAQGAVLMNAIATRTTYNGAGLSVAIVDTGIDYLHPMMGGAAFPNAKVIGGYDFGDDDADPMDCNGHGTRCAGLAAGSLSVVGNYIGGIAYNAKIYGLKIVSNCASSAASSSMTAAWDWCVTHKNDDPANPIMVISTSFGGGRYFDPCDAANPSRTAAANAAVAAGITLTCSSGNSGYCDSTGAPSCISGVIAVGAVYDANLGSISHCVSSASCAPKVESNSCSSGWVVNVPSAQAGAVIAYSNAAPFLGVLAPSNNATTTSLNGAYTNSFSGTSAACPYAAGAIACLQQAALTELGAYLTPAQVRTTLDQTGTPTLDSKVAITKSRVNLGNAVASLCPCLGDVNRDGVKNGEDIQSFTICMLTGGACGCANIDQVAGMTAADMGLFVNDLVSGTPCP